jgi:hypothetical protein
MIQAYTRRGWRSDIHKVIVFEPSVFKKDLIQFHNHSFGRITFLWSTCLSTGPYR